MTIDPDFWRGVTFAQAGIVVVLTTIIIARYRNIPRSPDRAFPLHIAGIGTSYLLACVFMVLELIARWNNGYSYRIPLALVTFALGDAALIFMLVHLSVQRKHIGAIRQRVAKEQ